MNNKILRSAQDDREDKKIFRVCAECEAMLRDAGYVLIRQGERELGACECCEKSSKDLVYPVTWRKRRR